MRVGVWALWEPRLGVGGVGYERIVQLRTVAVIVHRRVEGRKVDVGNVGDTAQ